MDPTPPSATPPRRLFRLGRADDPLAPLPGPPDAAFGGAAVVLCSTRRGAFVEVLVPSKPGAARTGLPPAAVVVALRFADPRPLLDLRPPLDPAAAAESTLLPPGGTEVVLRAERWAETFAEAVAAGFAGIAYRSTLAPSQVCWAVSRDAALALLAAPRPVSPHDPDLVAVGRLLDWA